MTLIGNQAEQYKPGTAPARQIHMQQCGTLQVLVSSAVDLLEARFSDPCRTFSRAYNARMCNVQYVTRCTIQAEQHRPEPEPWDSSMRALSGDWLEARLWSYSNYRGALGASLAWRRKLRLARRVLIRFHYLRLYNMLARSVQFSRLMCA